MVEYNGTKNDDDDDDGDGDGGDDDNIQNIFIAIYNM